MNNTIEIKNWKTGKIIFSYTHKFNTVKITVEEAVKKGVSLVYADLSDSDLTYINLSNIDLSYVNLKNTNLRFANLSGANLSNANLYHTNFKYVDLSYANLSNTDISFTYYFAFADLNGTNLTNANLTNVDLVFTDISTTILDNVKGLNNQCPKEGSFIGWKRCDGNDEKCYIVKLEIPADAKHSLCTSIRCKCDKAKVIEIQNLDGTKADIDEVQLRYNPSFKYKVGEIIEVSDFDKIYQKKYASVIYFFMNRGNAIIFN